MNKLNVEGRQNFDIAVIQNADAIVNFYTNDQDGKVSAEKNDGTVVGEFDEETGSGWVLAG